MDGDFDLDAESSSGDEHSHDDAQPQNQRRGARFDDVAPAVAVIAAVESPTAPTQPNEWHTAAAAAEAQQESPEQADDVPFPTAGLSPVVARSAPALAPAAAAALHEADDDDEAEASGSSDKRSTRNKRKASKNARAQSNSNHDAAVAAAAPPMTPAPAAAASAASAPIAAASPATLMSLAASENESSSPRRPHAHAAPDSVASAPSPVVATPLAAPASESVTVSAAPSDASLLHTPMSVHSFSVHSGSLAATPVQPRAASTVPASAVAAGPAPHNDASAAALSTSAAAATTQRAVPAPRTRSTSARRSDSIGSTTSSTSSTGVVRPHTGLSSSLATAKKPQPELPPRVVFSVTVPKEFRCAQKQSKAAMAAAAAAASAASTAADEKDAADLSHSNTVSSVKVTPQQQEATIARLYRSAAEKEEWLIAERRRKEEEEVADLKQFRREPRPTSAVAPAAAAADSAASKDATASADATTADSSSVSRAAKLYYRAIVEAELRERQLREAAQAQAAQFKFKPELNPHSLALATQSKRNTDHTSPTRQARSLLASSKTAASPGKGSGAAESKTNDADAESVLAPPPTILAAFTASSNAEFTFHPSINPHSKAMLAAAATAADGAESAEAARKRKKAERLARHLASEAQELTFRPTINPPHAATASWTRSAGAVKDPAVASSDETKEEAHPSAATHRTRAFSPSSSSRSSTTRGAPLSPRSQTQVKELYKILYKEDGTKRVQPPRPHTAAASSSATTVSASPAKAQLDRPKSAAAPGSVSTSDASASAADLTQQLAVDVAGPPAGPASSENVTPHPASGSEHAAVVNAAEPQSAAGTDAAWSAAAAASVPELTLDQTVRRTRDRNPTAIGSSKHGGSSTRSREGSQSARSSGASQPTAVFVAAHIPARMQVWSTQAAERKDLIRRTVEERALAECTFAPKTNAPIRRRSAGRSSSGSGEASAAATLARAQRIAREWTNAATFAVPATASSPGSSNSPPPSGIVDPVAASGADAAVVRPGSASSAVHQRVLPSRSLMVSSTLVPEVHALGFHFVRQERARVLRREEEFVRTGQHRGVALGSAARSTSATRSAAPTVAPTVQVSPRAHQRIVAPLAQQPAKSYAELHVPSTAAEVAAAAADLPQPQPQPQPAQTSRSTKPQPQQQSRPRSQAAAPVPSAAVGTVLAPAVALPVRPSRLHQAAVATVPSHRLTSPPRLASTSPHGSRSQLNSSSSMRRRSQSPLSLLQSVGGVIDANGNLSFAHSPAGSPRSRTQRSRRLSGGSGTEALLSPNSTLLQLSSLDLGHAVGASPPFASRSLGTSGFATANASLDLDHGLTQEDKDVWQAQVLAERLRLEHARLRRLQRAQQHPHHSSSQKLSSQSAASIQQQQQGTSSRVANGMPSRKVVPLNSQSPPRSNAASMPTSQQQSAAPAYDAIVTVPAPARRSALQSALAAVTDNLPNLDALLHRSMLREMEHRGDLERPASSIVSPHNGSGNHSPLVLVPVAALSSMSQASRSQSPASMLRAMEMHSPSSAHNSPPRNQQVPQSQLTPPRRDSAVSLARDLPPSPVAAYFSPPPQPMQQQRTPPAADTTTAAAAGAAEPSVSRSRGGAESEAEPSLSRRGASASGRAGDVDGFDAGSVDPDLSFGEDDADESITSEVEEDLYESDEE